MPTKSIAPARPARMPQEGAGQPRQAAVLGATLLAHLGWVLAVDGAPLPGDEGATSLARDWAAGRPARVLTQLGSGAVLFPVLLLFAVRDWRRRTRGYWWPMVTLALAQVVEAVAFVTVARERIGQDHVSFSSGHAMSALVGWALVARTLGRPRARWPYVVALVVGATRVGLGEHWPSDVVAGWLFGALVLLGYDAVARRRLHHDAAGDAPSAEQHHVVASNAVANWLVRSPWAWCAPVLAALASLVPLLTVADNERMKDLLVYVGAGGTAGRGADVYDFRTAFDMPFTYPPFAAMLSEPLSRIPLAVVQVLWVVASLAVLVAVARIAMHPVVDRIGLPVTLTLLLLSSPVRSHLRFGQVGVFLVLIVASDLICQHTHEGVGVGIAVATKLTPAVMLPWLALARGGRQAVRAVLVAAVATATGMLLLWPSSKEYLWRALWDSSRFGRNAIPGNQSVRGMLLRTALPEQHAERLWLLAAVVLVAVGTMGAVRLERQGHRLGAVGVLAALSIAVSPISWVHHLVWLVLPISALVASRRVGLAVIWSGLLMPGLPAAGAAGLRSPAIPEPFWHLVMDAQGLTAVAAVVLLPRLLRPRAG